MSTNAWPLRARCLAAWSVRKGTPVLRTSSAVTRSRVGTTGTGCGEGERAAADRTELGRVGALEALRDEGEEAALRAAGAMVRLVPRSCSTVITFGACLEALCGRAGVRSVPRSWSAVSSTLVTRDLLGPADMLGRRETSRGGRVSS